MFSAKNLKDSIKNKPPLVLFTFFLILLTIALLSFAISIQYAEFGDLTNTDVKQNWVMLKKHFNKLYTYVHHNRSNKQDIINNDFPDKHSVYTIVQAVGLNNLKNISHVQGILTLKGWVSNCPESFPKPDFMTVKFILPDKNQTYNKTDICVEISGPRKYLPIFSKPACALPKHEKNNFGILRSINLYSEDEAIQVNQIKIKLKFNSELDEDISDRLTSLDVTVIYTHLKWCSYFLAVVIICILVYMFHKDSFGVDDI